MEAASHLSGDITQGDQGVPASGAMDIRTSYMADKLVYVRRVLQTLRAKQRPHSPPGDRSGLLMASKSLFSVEPGGFFAVISTPISCTVLSKFLPLAAET